VKHGYSVITNGYFSNFQNDGSYKPRQVAAGTTKMLTSVTHNELTNTRTSSI